MTVSSAGERTAGQSSITSRWYWTTGLGADRRQPLDDTVDDQPGEHQRLAPGAQEETALWSSSSSRLGIGSFGAYVCGRGGLRRAPPYLRPRKHASVASRGHINLVAFVVPLPALVRPCRGLCRQLSMVASIGLCGANRGHCRSPALLGIWFNSPWPKVPSDQGFRVSEDRHGTGLHAPNPPPPRLSAGSSPHELR